jgi:hypothetical protein
VLAPVLAYYGLSMMESYLGLGLFGRIWAHWTHWTQLGPFGPIGPMGSFGPMLGPDGGRITPKGGRIMLNSLAREQRSQNGALYEPSLGVIRPPIGGLIRAHLGPLGPLIPLGTFGVHLGSLGSFGPLGTTDQRISALGCGYESAGLEAYMMSGVYRSVL